MDFSDIIYTVFLLMCAWIASEINGGGGGKRQRVPVRG